MGRFLLSFCLGVAAIANQGLAAIAQTTTQMAVSNAASAEGGFSPAQCPAIPNAQTYDVVVFGDEVPGIMTALKVQRELKRRGHSDAVAVVTEGNTRHGLGGHLVRGGVAINASAVEWLRKQKGEKFIRLTNAKSSTDEILPLEEVPFGPERTGHPGAYFIIDPEDLAGPVFTEVAEAPF